MGSLPAACDALGLHTLEHVPPYEKAKTKVLWRAGNTSWPRGHYRWPSCGSQSQNNASHRSQPLWVLLPASREYADVIPEWAAGVRAAGLPCVVARLDRSEAICSEANRAGCRCVQSHVTTPVQSDASFRAGSARAIAARARFEVASALLAEPAQPSILMHDADALMGGGGLAPLASFVQSVAADFAVQSNMRRPEAFDDLQWGFVWLSGSAASRHALQCLLSVWEHPAFRRAKDDPVVSGYWYSRSQPRINHLLEAALVASGGASPRTCLLPKSLLGGLRHATYGNVKSGAVADKIAWLLNRSSASSLAASSRSALGAGRRLAARSEAVAGGAGRGKAAEGGAGRGKAARGGAVLFVRARVPTSASEVVRCFQAARLLPRAKCIPASALPAALGEAGSAAAIVIVTKYAMKAAAAALCHFANRTDMRIAAAFDPVDLFNEVDHLREPRFALYAGLITNNPQMAAAWRAAARPGTLVTPIEHAVTYLPARPGETAATSHAYRRRASEPPRFFARVGPPLSDGRPVSPLGWTDLSDQLHEPRAELPESLSPAQIEEDPFRAARFYSRAYDRLDVALVTCNARKVYSSRERNNAWNSAQRMLNVLAAGVPAVIERCECHATALVAARSDAPYPPGLVVSSAAAIQAALAALQENATLRAVAVAAGLGVARAYSGEATAAKYRLFVDRLGQDESSSVQARSRASRGCLR